MARRKTTADEADENTGAEGVADGGSSNESDSQTSGEGADEGADEGDAEQEALDEANAESRAMHGEGEYAIVAFRQDSQEKPYSFDEIVSRHPTKEAAETSRDLNYPNGDHVVVRTVNMKA